MGACCGLDRKDYIQDNKPNIAIQADPSTCESLINDSIFKNQNNAEHIVKELLKHIMSKNPHRTNISLERIFKASQHKFKVASFHQRCHQKTNTIVVVRTAENRIYGGYTPCAWLKDQSYSYQQDQKSISFLFTVKDDKVQIFQLNEKQKTKAIMNHQESGPIFGEGHDLYISDECNKHDSWNNIGKTYKSNFTYGSNKSNKQLSGQLRHKIQEYQVWEIV